MTSSFRSLQALDSTKAAPLQPDFEDLAFDGPAENHSQETMDGSRVGYRDYEIMANFRHALRKYLADSERVAVDVGLTAQRYQALLAICTRTVDKPISVGELAKHLVIRPHSAAELVARLEAAGLVMRREDSLDRRRVLLNLTDEGARRLERIVGLQIQELSEHRQSFARMIDLLPLRDSVPPRT